MYFRVITSTDNAWNCQKTVNLGNGDQQVITQEKNNIVTADTIVSSQAARTHNQVDGFNLLGYEASQIISQTNPPTPPQTGSCPDASSTFVQGSLQTSVTTSGLQVSITGNSGPFKTLT